MWLTLREYREKYIFWEWLDTRISSSYMKYKSCRYQDSRDPKVAVHSYGIRSRRRTLRLHRQESKVVSWLIYIRLKEPEACKFFQQIISGLEYMHKLRIVHRDLKPENLLIDFRQNIKFVDFGLSNTYNPDENLKTACGSPCYAPPEVTISL
jgi:serine/threonine protein kinase